MEPLINRFNIQQSSASLYPKQKAVNKYVALEYVLCALGKLTPKASSRGKL